MAEPNPTKAINALDEGAAEAGDLLYLRKGSGVNVDRKLVVPEDTVLNATLGSGPEQVETNFRRLLKERIERDATLILGFANNRYRIYEGLTDGHTLKPFNEVLTYSRLSNAKGFSALRVLGTALDDQQRLVFDPAAGGALGLLVEGEATNIGLHSESFDNSFWTKTQVTIEANSIQAPDGNVTADKLVENSEDAAHFIQGAVSQTDGDVFTLSAFAKKGEREWVRLSHQDSSRAAAWFNLTTGEVGSVRGDQIIGANIQRAGDGYFRCSISYTAAGNFYQVLLANENGSSSYQGDGASGLFAWGVQVEAGNTLSSYIKTTAAAATRAPDVVSQGEVGKWLNRSGATFIVEYQPLLPQNFGARAILGTNFSNGSIVFHGSGAEGFGVDLRNLGGSLFFANPFINRESAPRFRMVVTFSPGGAVGFYVNGDKRASGSGFDFSGITEFFIGRREGQNTFENGNYSELKTLPYALTEAQAIEESKL